MSVLDVAAIKRDFPIFEREVNGKRLTYLDSASSTQKQRVGVVVMRGGGGGESARSRR